MIKSFVPAYRKLLDRGELQARVAAAREMLRACVLCPRRCRVNRLEGKLGACSTGGEAMVSSYGPHFGEERPLVGSGGSGTIFLTNCNLDCIFCQNSDISHSGLGKEMRAEELADIMLDLQQRGCHNINWVTPTHQMPALLEALEIAARPLAGGSAPVHPEQGRRAPAKNAAGVGLRRSIAGGSGAMATERTPALQKTAAKNGLALPIVYNCGGYESPEALRLLDGIVDIYMPDMKYGNSESGQRLSGAPAYWGYCKEALAEMHRQVGDLILDKRGLARRGLLVRHLVLPHNLADTKTVMAFLASLSKDTYVNVMAQYHPCYRAEEIRELSRPLAQEEYQQAVNWAREAGLHRLDGQK